MYHYPLGVCEANFEEIAKILKPMIDKLKLPAGHYILAETSEDETTVLSTLDYDQRSDKIVGSCGRHGPNHTCDSHCAPVVGDGDQAQSVIDDVCNNYVRAPYLRLILFNPLHKDLPRLAISISPTCNKFDAAWVEREWVEIDRLWDKHLLPLGINRTGHASDGDARRFKNQKLHMTAPVSVNGSNSSLARTPFTLAHEGFTLSGTILADGRVTDLESQDPIHCVKKLWGPMLSTRSIYIGNYLATHAHIQNIFDRFDRSSHDVDKMARDMADRQNFMVYLSVQPTQHAC